MSIQSDAAKNHIEMLLRKAYGEVHTHVPSVNKSLLFFDSEAVNESKNKLLAFREYLFAYPDRRWRFDYAIPDLKVAIELDGGLFIKGAHSNPAAIRSNMFKMNAAASAGWRVWRYTPEMVIKAGRKTMEDEPVLKELPWTVK